MKTKKFFTWCFTALCAIVLAVTFTACGDDDDPVTPPVVDENVTKIDFTFKLTFSQSVLDIANVSVTYLDDNNNEQTEAITSTTWTKRTIHTSVPTKFSYNVHYDIKEGISPTQEFNISWIATYDYNALNQSGQIVFSKSNSFYNRTEGASGDILEKIFSNPAWADFTYTVTGKKE